GQQPLVAEVGQPLSHGLYLLVPCRADSNHRKWTIKYRYSSLPIFGNAVHIRNLRSQQPVSLCTDLMRRSVVDPESTGASTNVNAQGAPRKRLLEDALPQIAGEEEAVRPVSAKGRKESQVRHTQVLRFINNDVVEDRFLAL